MCLTLYYKGYYNFRHWDELYPSNDIIDSSIKSTSWPKQIQFIPFRKVCPLLLVGNTLKHGSEVTFNLFNTKLIFEVAFNANTFPDTLKLKVQSCPQADHSTTTCIIGMVSPTSSNLNILCRSVLPLVQAAFEGSSWHATRSLLIYDPEYLDTTHLMKTILHLCAFKWPQVVSLNVSSVGILSARIIESMHLTSKLRRSNQSKRCQTYSRILVFVDENSYCSTTGYLLQMILSMLTKSNCKHSRLFVIAIQLRTVSKHPLLRTMLEFFDMTLSTACFSVLDRTVLLQRSLFKLGSLEDFSGSWAVSLAVLTTGRSFVNLIKLIWSVFIASNEVNCDAEVDRKTPIPWKFALLAISLIIPQQPVELKSVFPCSKIVLDTENLALQDFCGNGLSISRLSRIIRCYYPAQKIKQVAQHGVLLYGPPACGKTFIAHIIASELKINFLPIKSSQLLSKFFGQSERIIRCIFQYARENSPFLLFFDDFDILAIRNDEIESNGLYLRVLSTFLNELDGILAKNLSATTQKKLIVVVACSDISRIDDALLRPGRLQQHIYLAIPSENEVREMLFRRLYRTVCTFLETGKTSLLALIDIIIPSVMNMNPSGADIDALVKLSINVAIRESMLNVPWKPIRKTNFLAVLPPSISG